MDDYPSTPGSPNSVGFSTDRLPRTSIGGVYSEADEADVDPDVFATDAGDDEEEEGEDLYNDNFMEQDYRALGSQDRYESQDIDDELEDERDLDQIMADRRAAEAELDARTGGDGGAFGRKLPRMLHDRDEDSEVEYRPKRRARVEPAPVVDQTEEEVFEEEEPEDENEYEMYNVQGSLREWVTRDEVRRFIGRKFRQFLMTYVNPKNGNGEPEYVRLIDEMVAANKCSLEMDYKQFIHTHPNIAIWLADAPQSVLEVLEEVALNVVLRFHPN